MTRLIKKEKGAQHSNIVMMDMKRKKNIHRTQEPRNIHNIPIWVRSGNEIHSYSMKMEVHVGSRQEYKFDPKNPDKLEIDAIKKLSESIGKVNIILRIPGKRTPDMEIEVDSVRIYIECKFVEGPHDLRHIRDGCAQILEYCGHNQALGIICLIYRNYSVFPNLSDYYSYISGKDKSISIKELERIQNFLKLSYNIISGKNIMVILFPHVAVGFSEYFDSTGHMGYFYFEKKDINAWFKRIHDLSCPKIKNEENESDRPEARTK